VTLASKDVWRLEREEHVRALASYWLEERQEMVIKKKRPQDAEGGAQKAWDELTSVFGEECFLKPRRATNWKSEEAPNAHVEALKAWLRDHQGVRRKALHGALESTVTASLVTGRT
jgi:hypothetical protein